MDEVTFGPLHGRQVTGLAGVEQSEQLTGGGGVAQVMGGARSQRPGPARVLVGHPESAGVSQRLLVLSGVGIANMQGTSTDTWEHDQVTMLGAGDASVVGGLNYAVSHWGIPQPQPTFPFFQVDQYSPFAGLNSIYDAGESLYAGFAVDSWQLQLDPHPSPPRSAACVR
jgi:hypothetical protein